MAEIALPVAPLPRDWRTHYATVRRRIDCVPAARPPAPAPPQRKPAPADRAMPAIAEPSFEAVLAACEAEFLGDPIVAPRVFAIYVACELTHLTHAVIAAALGTYTGAGVAALLDRVEDRLIAEPALVDRLVRIRHRLREVRRG